MLNPKALDAAMRAYWECPVGPDSRAYVEAAIEAYLAASLTRDDIRRCRERLNDRQCIHELRRWIEASDAPHTIRSILGSMGDTLSDAEVVAALRSLNDGEFTVIAEADAD